MYSFRFSLKYLITPHLLRSSTPEYAVANVEHGIFFERPCRLTPVRISQRCRRTVDCVQQCVKVASVGHHVLRVGYFSHIKCHVVLCVPFFAVRLGRESFARPPVPGHI